MTPEQRRQGLAFNAVSRTLSAHDEFVRLSVRQAVARAVLAAIGEPNPPTQDSTGWAWTCHRDACPHGQEGFWTRRGARRARDRHLNTHGADHA